MSDLKFELFNYRILQEQRARIEKEKLRMESVDKVFKEKREKAKKHRSRIFNRDF